MELIDSHCHLHDRQFFSEEQAEAMLTRAREKGIREIVCIGTDPEDSLAAARFAAVHRGIYWTYGVHPEEKKWYENPGGGILKEIINGEPDPNQQIDRSADASRAAQKIRPPVAIGEVGLDYHTDGYDREAQIRLLEEMLQLAKDYDLPLSFHVRNAFVDFFPVVANFPGVRGVVHSFTDSKKVLRRILETTDFYVGVNGLATYSTLPTPPLERILLETDAPFLTPVPFRGIINESGYIYEIAQWLSGKLGVDLATVSKETTENARRLYKFQDTIIREGADL